MPSLEPEQVIAFKKRQTQEQETNGVYNVASYKDASHDVIRINTGLMAKEGDRSLPLLESLHRRRLIKKRNLLRSNSSLLSISDEEKSCIHHVFTEYEPSEYDAFEIFTSIREKLNWLRQRSMFCDVTVKCGASDQDFVAHCAVLAAGSQLCSELIDKSIQTRRSESVENKESETDHHKDGRGGVVDLSNCSLEKVGKVVEQLAESAPMRQSHLDRNMRNDKSLSWIKCSQIVTRSKSEPFRPMFPLVVKRTESNRFGFCTERKDTASLLIRSCSDDSDNDWETEVSSNNSRPCVVKEITQQILMLHPDHKDCKINCEENINLICSTHGVQNSTGNTLHIFQPGNTGCAVGPPLNESGAEDNVIIPFLEIPSFHDGSETEEKLVIHINDVDDPRILGIVLEFIYTGTLSELQTLPVSKLCDVQQTARVLKVKGIDVFSEEVMCQTITYENFIELWQLAEERKDGSIKSGVLEYVTKYIADDEIMNVVASQPGRRKEEFITFSKNRLKVLFEDGLRVLLAWANYFPKERKRLLLDLLPKLTYQEERVDWIDEFLKNDNFAKLLSSELLKYIRGRSLLRNQHPSADDKQVSETLIPACLPKKVNKRKVTLSSTHQNSRPAHRLISRVLVEKMPLPLADAVQLRMVHADASETSLNNVGIARPLVNEPLSPLTSPEVSYPDGTCQPGNPCIAIVGKISSMKMLYMIKYDQFGQVLDEDTLHPTLTEDTQGLNLISFYNFVVIAGNDMEFMPVSVPSSNWQTPIHEMQTDWELNLPPPSMFPRRGFQVFMVGSTLYLCGGEGNREGYLANVEVLDFEIKDGCWQKIDCMRHRRAGHSVVCTDDGYVIIVGGGTHKCEIYNIHTKQWNEIASLPWRFRYCDIHVFIVGQEVVAMGCMHPLCIYVLDRRCWSPWEQHRLTGKPPKEVTSTTVCLERVYALSNKRLYYFEMANKEWYLFAQIQRLDFEALFLSSWEIPTE